MYELAITSGLSENCKFVLFVLYKVPIDRNIPLMYMGSLAQDFDVAFDKATKIAEKHGVPLKVWDSGLLEKRRGNSTFPFGKYVGKTVEYVFDNDKPYLLWASRNIKYNKKHSNFYEMLTQYSTIAKEEIIDENRKTSVSEYLPIETKSNLKKLTVITVKNFGIDFYGNEKIETTLTDENGNLFVYVGKNLGVEPNNSIERKFKVTQNFEKMGVKYNTLKLR